MTVAAMAASALFLGISSSIQATEHTLQQTIAQGMAEQILDEALGQMYASALDGYYQWPLCPSVWETQGLGRARYNDVDDYHGFAAQPPTAHDGIALGQGDGAGGLRHPNFRLAQSAMQNWHRAVTMYYVSNSDPSVRLANGVTSNFRCIEVVVSVDNPDGNRREVARVRHVVAYVPHP